MSLLEGKIAIVTGAGSGIGRASAVRFAREGAHVVVADVRLAKAQETVDLIGNDAVVAQVDVGNAAQIEAMVQVAVDTYGGLDVLFNNAATTRLGTAVELSASDWDMIWRTNVSSVFFGAKYAVPVMASRGGGTIVSTASVSGLSADAGQVAYAATKAAVINLTRALAVDHAGQGIRANCLCPGMTATPSLLHALKADDHLRTVGSAAPPLRRLAEPEEMAAAAVWLASSESSYVNGETLVVDGGLTAQTHFSQIGSQPR
ncbi:MAG: 3-oxoacyl-ACP reductase [Frankiales bacterium]|nr:3-oxoacyl-ACP reductase [Frankiales bacterium]